MNFRTRIDFTNRQAKQYEKTDISLSGGTVFGLPYSALTSGFDVTSTGITFENAALQSTYSGNTGTTVYTFGDSRMSIDEGDLSALTPSNSGTTQYAGPTWAGYNMFTTTDGYTGWTNYSAVTYDLDVVTMVDLGGGAYSGIVQSDFIVYSAGSLDYTGRTIWVDVSGITRTDELIVSKNPVIGYVLTCTDVEGKGIWSPSSGSSGTTFWQETGAGSTALIDIKGGHTINGTSNNSMIAGGSSGFIGTTVDSFIGGGESGYITTSTHSAILGGSGNTINTARFSSILGGTGNTINTARFSTILGGTNNTISGSMINTVILGGSGITATHSNATYFLTGFTNSISGYSNNTNRIDFRSNNGSYESIRISTLDGFSDTRYLDFDEAGAVTLARNGQNFFSTSNGVTSSVASNQSVMRTSSDVVHFEANNYGGFIQAINKYILLSTANIGGTISANASLDEGSMQAEFVIGKENTYAFSAGTFGTGNGNQQLSGSSDEYFTVFLSTPRSRTYDNTSYSSIRNNLIGGGAGHIMLTGTTNSAIIGGTGNTTTSGVTNTVLIACSGVTASTSNIVYVPDLIIDGLTSTDPLATNADGKIIAGASDARLKKNIEDLTSALDKVLQLRGVSYEWTEDSNMGSGVKFGLIAQEVEKIIPEMVRERSKGDGMLTLSYTEIIPWLIEAIKELASGSTKVINNNLIIETQTIASEDNNIELNYNGNHQTALGGGIKVLNAVKDGVHSEIKIDNDGRWIITPTLMTSQLSLPEHTPTSTSDTIGETGDVVWDDNYIYIKRNNGWGRTKLEDF